MYRPKIRWAAAAAVLVLLGGCDNTLQTQAQAAPPILPPGVHAVVVVTSGPAGTPEVQLHLRRQEVQSRIASYQGELRYDVSRLEVQGGAFPPGAMGAWNEVEPGLIRFAAAAPEGLAGTLALTLRATPHGEVDESAFQVRMDELVGAAGFENLTARFVHRAHPLFSTSPLPE